MQGCLTGTTLDTIEGADPSTGRNWLAFCELQMVLGKVEARIDYRPQARFQRSERRTGADPGTFLD
ncbi:hypothetical protein T4B_1389 [Trichinella pseudospiralis]|uniref:Uncharacterized protein n=1 Tax=Trichinella pseudospiralis TaxID=6337 RepID=A0A0V1GVM2_TRIPS|nr:hypothetical protein T4B_1389 [Trichinella pseudospiralis]